MKAEIVCMEEFAFPVASPRKLGHCTSLPSSSREASPAFSPADVALWAGRSSTDGRLGVLLASSLRGMGMALESPGGSSTGTPTGPTCTGGGHGEAPLSVAGHNARFSTPALRQPSSNMHNLLGPICTATATPLARQVATRALRKAGDSAPITLPSISSLNGSARLRDVAPPTIQLPSAAPDGGGTAGSSGGSSPPASPSATSSPRPPALSPHNGYGPSPRMRRSTAADTHAESDACQYVAVSAAAAAAAAAGTSAISAPSCTDMMAPANAAATSSQQQPFERFSRLASLGHYHDTSYGIPENASDGGGGDASKGEVAAAAAEAEAAEADTASPSHGANSMPLYKIRYQDLSSQPQQSSATAAANTAANAAANAVAVSTAVAFKAAVPGSGATASAPRVSAARHASTSQLSFRSHGLTPYNHVQYTQSRLPPRRVSDYSMLPAPPESTLPKLKSAASATASASASSLKASEAPSPLSASPPPPVAVAVTAVAENAAAAAPESHIVRPKAMRCINLEPLQPPAGTSGDGAASSSGTGSLSSGSAKGSSVGGPTSTAAAAAEAMRPLKRSMDPSQPPSSLQLQPQPQPQPLSKQVQTPRGARPLAAPVSPFFPYSTAMSAGGLPPAAAAAPSPSPYSPADSDLPSPPASSDSSPLTSAQPPPPPGPPLMVVVPAAAQQQQSQPPGSPLDDFVPRPNPAQGLLHFSPAAPVQMLRAPVSWGVSDYKVVRKLYAGYASSVYKASCCYSGGDVVLKAYNLAGLSTFLRNQVLRELDIHSRLRHPGAVHLMAAFREGDLLLFVLEYVRGGSLDRVRRKLGGRMTEFQAMHLVLLPLLGVLTYLHERGIVHRDIKPENLLFTENWQLKLCDYGVSICLREERAVTRTGSREYMAPEVNICPLKRGPEDNKTNLDLAYSPAVDVWSLGSLMYELLVGFTPFPGGPPARREGARGSAGACLAFPSSVSQGAREFVRSCLEIEPADRPTVHQLTQHPWIQEALEYNASLQSPGDAP